MRKQSLNDLSKVTWHTKPFFFHWFYTVFLKLHFFGRCSPHPPTVYEGELLQPIQIQLVFRTNSSYLTVAIGFMSWVLQMIDSSNLYFSNKLSAFNITTDCPNNKAVMKLLYCVCMHARVHAALPVISQPCYAGSATLGGIKGGYKQGCRWEPAFSAPF